MTSGRWFIAVGGYAKGHNHGARVTLPCFDGIVVDSACRMRVYRSFPIFRPHRSLTSWHTTAHRPDVS